MKKLTYADFREYTEAENRPEVISACFTDSQEK